MILRRQKFNQDDAETIALQGLTFLVADPQRLVRFLSLTGLTPSDLKGFSSDSGLQVAVLEHLLADESLLLVFASENSIRPEMIGMACDVINKSSGRSR